MVAGARVVTEAAETRVVLGATAVDETVVETARAVVVAAKPVVVVEAPGMLLRDAAAIASTSKVRLGNGL